MERIIGTSWKRIIGRNVKNYRKRLISKKKGY